MEHPIKPLEDLLSFGLGEDKEKYLTSGPNKYRLTKGLFWELSYDYPDRRDFAIYTLSDCSPSYFVMKDGIPRYDLRLLYTLCNDHTEWNFINKFMWDKSHWEKVTKAPLIKPHVDKWRDELKHSIKSKMYSVLVDDALSLESKTKTSSAKYLLEKYLDPKTSKPLKVRERKMDDQKVLSQENFIMDEDLARIKNVN